MKIIQVPFTFAPDPVGGTEIYVEALAQALQHSGVECVIAAPSCDGTNDAYQYNGLRVRRYLSAPESKHMLRELYGDGDPVAGEAFARILDDEAPDVLHMHAFTRGVSLQILRHAKQRRMASFFTYHTPTVSCQRGTLMLWGREVCDGVLDVHRCTDCSLSAKGLPRLASMPLSYLPSLFAKPVEVMNLSGGLWTAMRMRDLIRLRCEAFRALAQEVDGIVALRQWVKTLLIRNGIPKSKITLSTHGLIDHGSKAETLIDATSKPLRVAFLGRANLVKGIDTLVKAVKAAPDLDIELHLYGVAQGRADHEYCARLESLAAHDDRIKFLAPVPHDRVIPLLASYHFLAVPSQWMETGPLVMLEAFAAGTPVIGSRLGGIAEWIRHGENGLLVNFGDVAAWTETLKACAADRPLVSCLRNGVRPPRKMEAVVDEMLAMYRSRSSDENHRPADQSIFASSQSA